MLIGDYGVSLMTGDIMIDRIRLPHLHPFETVTTVTHQYRHATGVLIIPKPGPDDQYPPAQPGVYLDEITADPEGDIVQAALTAQRQLFRGSGITFAAGSQQLQLL
jgi:hypothetical protein